MLFVQVEPGGARQVAGVVQGEHAGAGRCVLRVGGAHVAEDLGVRGIVAIHGVQQLAEGLLRVGDLGVVLAVAGQERHRPVVALGRDGIEHLLRPTRLDLEAIEVLHPLVHPPDDDETQDRHRHEQQGAGEEAEEQLLVDARPDPRGRVDERAQPAREPRQSWLRDGHRDIPPGRPWSAAAGRSSAGRPSRVRPEPVVT